MKYDMPEEVNSDADGFRALAELRARAAKQKSGEIEINMERTTWVSPQMCAPFGAILYEMEEAANTVRITNIVAEDVKETFSQNKFPYYLGGETKPEHHESIIPTYKRFRKGEDHNFYDHIGKFFAMNNISHLPEKLRKRFRQCLAEAFSNVTLHANSELGVFVCGQHLPNDDRFVFTFAISDLGVGIRHKVNGSLNKNFTAKEAIEWAVKEGATTKKDMPGGLGLASLVDFARNDSGRDVGRIKIISGNCFYRYKKGERPDEFESKFTELEHEIRGTTVIVEINTRLNAEFKYDMPPEVNADAPSFNALAKLRARAMNSSGKVVEINMEKTKWFSAQMCAPLGAILRELEQASKSVHITNLALGVKRALSQNKFLSEFFGKFDAKEFIDEWKTTIPYKELREDDQDAFDEYVRQLEQHNISNLHADLRNRCMRNLAEIFENVKCHAKSKLGVFICGQLYYGRNALVLAVTDWGIGIRKSVNECSGENWTAAKAIDWAVKARNSAKQEGPSGLGLWWLADFIDKNGGQLSIISGNCFWQRINGNNSSSMLEYELPGTTVVVETNTMVFDLKAPPLQAAS